MQLSNIIRETLRLPKNKTITNVHARQAALAAWLSYLRQNIGSCFATAPAILILKEQPERFFQDIEQLFVKGGLTRTFGGVEYSVPVSKSWGIGDLNRPIVIHRGKTRIEGAPGLILAFESAGILKKGRPFQEKADKIKSLIEEIKLIIFVLKPFCSDKNNFKRTVLLSLSIYKD